MKKALITGICGQDGAYLSRHLERAGIQVYGLARRQSPTFRLNYLKTNPTLIYGDVTEIGDIRRVLADVRPDYIYNLAAQSHVGFSFDAPHVTLETNYYGITNIINCVKSLGIIGTRIYQAGTSELFGYNDNKKLDENSPFAPRSPYAISKLAAHWAVKNARYEGLFASNGILFNHESPLRGEDFVTKKITRGIARIMADESFVLELGNLDAIRDWGHADDYTRAMRMILEHDSPDDFVVATGHSRTVRDFLMVALEVADIDWTVEGSGLEERFYWGDRMIVKINPKFYRPNDVRCLIGNHKKADEVLGWRPKTNFVQMIEEMIKYDRENYDQ